MILLACWGLVGPGAEEKRHENGEVSNPRFRTNSQTRPNQQTRNREPLAKPQHFTHGAGKKIGEHSHPQQCAKGRREKQRRTCRSEPPKRRFRRKAIKQHGDISAHRPRQYKISLSLLAVGSFLILCDPALSGSMQVSCPQLCDEAATSTQHSVPTNLHALCSRVPPTLKGYVAR